MTTELERLERWLAHGGTCRIAGSVADRWDIALCRCDGGEEVERLTTTDPAVAAWVRANGTD